MMEAILRLGDWEKVITLTNLSFRSGYVDEAFYPPMNILISEEETAVDSTLTVTRVRFWYIGRSKGNRPVFEYRF